MEGRNGERERAIGKHFMVIQIQVYSEQRSHYEELVLGKGPREL